MWAEAMAVSRFSRVGGNQSLADAFEARAHATRQMLLSLHWNTATESFAVVPLADRPMRHMHAAQLTALVNSVLAAHAIGTALAPAGAQ